MDYLQRFSLTHHVFPQNAHGESFFQTPSYPKLQRRFQMLSREPGLGVLVADVGVGKTSAMRNLCHGLPRPDFHVVYLCDTAVSPLDLYRQLAVELGLTPSHRRAQLWSDLKRTMAHMVDEQSVQPLLILDEAQHLSDRIFIDLSGFLNFAMDSRSLLTLWLVGQPALLSVLKMKRHAALASRIVTRVHLEPLQREDFTAFLTHGLEAAGVTSNILSDSGAEMLFRVSRGVPRQAARLMREALIVAHEQNKNFIDDAVLETVLDEENL